MSERSTLALLDDGKFILGVPNGEELSPELIMNLKNHIKLWSFPDSNLDLIIFPFAVDVVDLRTKHEPKPSEID